MKDSSNTPRLLRLKQIFGDPRANPPIEPIIPISRAEAFALAEGLNLEGIAKKNHHQRSEKFKDRISRALIWIFLGAIAAFILIVVSWLWHLLTPEKCHYLTLEQLDKIQTTITIIAKIFLR